MGFHTARNATSHVYDREAAEEVSASAKEFLSAAQKLLTSLHERND